MQKRYRTQSLTIRTKERIHWHIKNIRDNISFFRFFFQLSVRWQETLIPFSADSLQKPTRAYLARNLSKVSSRKSTSVLSGAMLNDAQAQHCTCTHNYFTEYQDCLSLFLFSKSSCLFLALMKIFLHSHTMDSHDGLTWIANWISARCLKMIEIAKHFFFFCIFPLFTLSFGWIVCFNWKIPTSLLCLRSLPAQYSLFLSQISDYSWSWEWDEKFFLEFPHTTTAVWRELSIHLHNLLVLSLRIRVCSRLISPEFFLLVYMKPKTEKTIHNVFIICLIWFLLCRLIFNFSNGRE